MGRCHNVNEHNVLYMAIVGGMGDNPMYGGLRLQLRLWIKE